MTKTATAKKATKTVPTSNHANPVLVPDDPEDGRYMPQQHMQGTESSPATTGEFNRTLNMAVHEVHQPCADEETSSAHARCRAAQE